MAKKKAEETDDSQAQEAAPDGTVTKTEAVKRALADGVTKPQDGVEYVREKFGLEMTAQAFSATKSLLRKKGGEGAGSGREARAAAPAEQTLPGGGVNGGNGHVPRNGSPDPVDLARQVKQLVAQYGAQAVKDMADVLGG